MSAQTTYNFDTAWGAAGGIFDLAPYEINSYLSAAAGIESGMGVYSSNGKTVGVAATSSNARKFVGVVTNNRTREMDIDGNAVIKANSAVGVMRYGKIYVQVADDVDVAFGDRMYLLYSGDDAGKFTNESDNAVDVDGVFSSAAMNGIAVATLYNTKTPAQE